MFETLFQSPEAIARHQAPPYAEERVRYLEHCACMLAIIGKRIFLDFRRPATGHANLVSGVGSAEMDRSSG